LAFQSKRVGGHLTFSSDRVIQSIYGVINESGYFLLNIFRSNGRINGFGGYTAVLFNQGRQKSL
jgi:hypothetical protein